MKSFLRNLPLKKKFTFIMLISVFILALASIVCINIVAKVHQKALNSAISTSLSYTSKEISNQLDNISSMADMILSDSIIQSNLDLLKYSDNLQIKGNSFRNIYETLNDYYFTYGKNSINYISIYQGDFTINSTSAINNSLPSDVVYDLCYTAKKANGKTTWVTKYSQSYGVFLVKNLKATKFLSLDSIGTLIININISNIVKNSTLLTSNFENTDYILYDENVLIYNSPSLNNNNISKFSNVFKRPYDFIYTNRNSYFYVQGTLPTIEWNFVCLVPSDDIVTTLKSSIYFCIAIIIFTIFIAIILSTVLIDSITKHFDTLLLKMKYFSFGNNLTPETSYDYTDRHDEVGILHNSFDQMTLQVNELVNEIYLKELLLKDAQLKVLESQINPHFLYNTLESINWRAKLANANDVSEMTESLGTLLRIALDHTNNTVPLKQEIDLIKSYMTIEKYRYEDKLDYNIIVPDELKDCIILKLALQPLVENAIRYGLEQSTENCFIQIIVDATDSNLFIYVKNTNSYFEDDFLEKLENEEIKPHGFGIGLLNIKERMHLTYDENFGLDVYNEDDNAVAKLKFPIIKKD